MGGGRAAPPPAPKPPGPGADAPGGGVDAECCIFHRKKAFDESSDESDGEDCDCFNVYETQPKPRPPAPPA